jgi:hypothetical protein
MDGFKRFLQNCQRQVVKPKIKDENESKKSKTASFV